MPKGRIIIFLIPASVLAAALVLIGIAATPPKFTARTTFAIDWNVMPSVPNDERADRGRSDWRKQIISEFINLPKSADALAAILENNDLLSNDPRGKNAIIAALKGRVRVKLVEHTADGDQFRIEVHNNDPIMARNAANAVLQGIISQIEGEAEFGGGLAAARSLANVANVVQSKADLEAERQSLLGNHSQPLTPEDRQRLQEIEQELALLEGDHAVAGLGLVVNLVGLLGTDAVKVIEETHVENRRAGYGLSVLFMAATLGCMAGVAGLVTRRLVQTKNATNATTPIVPPVIGPPQSVRRQPPFVGQIQSLSPPVLPPPISVQTR